MLPLDSAGTGGSIQCSRKNGPLAPWVWHSLLLLFGSNCTNMLALSLPRQGLDISASLEGKTYRGQS